MPEIGSGDYAVLKVDEPAVLDLRYEWRGNSVLCLHNLDGQPREVAFDPGVPDKRACLVSLLSADHSQGDGEGRHRVVLEGYGYRWYRVGGLDYVLRRTRG